MGQRVYAIGNAFGLDHSLSSGLISGLNRQIQGEAGECVWVGEALDSRRALPQLAAFALLAAAAAGPPLFM